MSEAHKGKHHSPETIEKMRNVKLGKVGKMTNHWQGGKVKKKCEICGKIFLVGRSRKDIAKYCSKECYYKSEKGDIPWNKGTIGIMKPNSGSFLKGHITWCLGKKGVPQAGFQKGKKHWNWKGGKTKESKRLRGGKEFRHWREAVFARDDYTCWICGQKGGRIDPHHLKKFSDYPKLRFEVSNGLTLCKFCHKTYTKFGQG